MGYNVIDLINKTIDISIKKKSIYKNIKQRNPYILSMDKVSTILINQIDKTIKSYEDLKSEIEDKSFEEIDLCIYDRISSLIDEFNKRMYEPQINNVRDLLEFSLASEKDIYSLLIDIQGRFMKIGSNVNTKTYKILSDMIENKVELIKILEKIIKIK